MLEGTFEPTEIGEIPIPLLTSVCIDSAEIDKLIHQRKIEEVLNIVEQKLLIEQMGFSQKEANQLELSRTSYPTGGEIENNIQ